MQLNLHDITYQRKKSTELRIICIGTLLYKIICTNCTKIILSHCIKWPSRCVDLQSIPLASFCGVIWRFPHGFHLAARSLSILPKKVDWSNTKRFECFARHDDFISGFVIGINSYVTSGMRRLSLDDHFVAPFVWPINKKTLIVDFGHWNLRSPRVIHLEYWK